MSTPKTHLIDVRTASEFATGALASAINIPHESILSLSTRPGVRKTDSITLYCRSGRRSAIALAALQDAGFELVRDIGGLDEAREVLRREEAEREAERREGVARGVDRGELERGTRTLLEGLRALG